MSKKNNNSNIDKNTDNHTKERKIRQVFPNGDVSGDTWSPKDIEELPKEEKKKDTIKKEETAESLHVIRIVSVIVAMIFSLLFAMAGGIGLALWDEGRTISELNTIVFAKEMDEAAEETPDTDESAILIADEEGSVPESESEPKPEPEPEPEPEEIQEPGPEEGADENDYGLTISADTDGVDSITKAGSSDEIRDFRDSDSGQAYRQHIIALQGFMYIHMRQPKLFRPKTARFLYLTQCRMMLLRKYISRSGLTNWGTERKRTLRKHMPSLSPGYGNMSQEP